MKEQYETWILEYKNAPRTRVERIERAQFEDMLSVELERRKDAPAYPVRHFNGPYYIEVGK